MQSLHPTDKEVLSSIISQYRILRLREMKQALDPAQKDALLQQDQLLAYEEYAVLNDDPAGRSIQDKVIQLYAPLMRAHYGHK